MKNLSTFTYAIWAGICIGIGGTIFLSFDNKFIGASLFSVGLFAVCIFKFNLFTGKVGYLFDNNYTYLLSLLNIWLVNLVGTAIVGYAIRLTRISGITEKAINICQVKLDDSLLSIFILAIFCNILMFIAVDGYKNNPHEIGKYLGIYLGVVVFILCGFEHCVANMFYFSAANVWDAKTCLYLIVMTLGNSIGGVVIPLARKLEVKAQNV